MTFLRKNYPLLVATIVFAAICGINIYFTTQLNEGHFTYSLDDAYIHLALSKNLAFHGMWGLSSDTFTNTSSSPIWTLILAIFLRILGNHDLIPLILNIVFCMLMLIYIHKTLRSYGKSRLLIMIALLLVVIITPLHVYVMIGMEHSLHALLSVVFLANAAFLFSKERYEQEMEGISSRKKEIFLYILAPFVGGVRYEGLFLVAGVCFLLLLKKEWVKAIFTGILAWIPAVTIGIISKLHGWCFFPNSLVLKGNTSSLSGFRQIAKFFFNFAYQTLDETMVLPFILIPLLFFFNKGFYKKSRLSILHNFVVIFAVNFLLHMHLARTGWIRYESYLFVMSIMVTTLFVPGHISSLKSYFRSSKKIFNIMFILALLTLYFTGVRTYQYYYKTYWGSNNIYNQQRQTALFLRKYYSGAEIVINDIGYPTYLTDFKMIDLYGLGSMDVINNMSKKTDFKSPLLASVIEKNYTPDLAVLYKHFAGDNYIKVAKTIIPNNIICADDEVYFYAFSKEQAVTLRQNFEEFSYELPENVEYELFDLEISIPDTDSTSLK